MFNFFMPKFLETLERRKLQDIPKWSTASNLSLVEVRYKDEGYNDLRRRGAAAPVGHGTRRPNGILSLLKGIVPATTVIRATKTN
jgi:hypothetical protein